MGKFNPDDRVIFKHQPDHVFTVVCDNSIHDSGRVSYQLEDDNIDSSAHPDLDWIPEYLLEKAPVKWNEGDVILFQGNYLAHRNAHWVNLEEFFEPYALRMTGPHLGDAPKVIGNISKLND